MKYGIVKLLVFIYWTFPFHINQDFSPIIFFFFDPIKAEIQFFKKLNTPVEMIVTMNFSILLSSTLIFSNNALR